MPAQIREILPPCFFTEPKWISQPVPCNPQRGAFLVLGTQKPLPQTVVALDIKLLALKAMMIRVACAQNAEVKMVRRAIFLVAFKIFREKKPCGLSIRFRNADIQFTGEYIAQIRKGLALKPLFPYQLKAVKRPAIHKHTAAPCADMIKQCKLFKLPAV